MGLFNRLFNKRERASGQEEEGSGNLAFVLLADARLPRPESIAQAFREYAAPGDTLRVGANDAGEDAGKEVISLELSTGENSFVALIPLAVPNGEADDGAQFSLSSFSNDWKLPPHAAHLLVTFHSTPESTPVERLSRFTSILAAVTTAAQAVGVYWGNAGATHDPEFFTSIASEQGISPRIVLWSGVSVAREKDGRLSLLSLGMAQLNLPDLLLVAGESSTGVAVETLYDLLAYVAARGEPLPDGDTVGRSEDERLPVRYVRSPLDASKRVWRVELP